MANPDHACWKQAGESPIISENQKFVKLAFSENQKTGLWPCICCGAEENQPAGSPRRRPYFPG
jgi:hypothetical protein